MIKLPLFTKHAIINTCNILRNVCKKILTHSIDKTNILDPFIVLIIAFDNKYMHGFKGDTSMSGRDKNKNKIIPHMV